jgi:23S rRNA (guanosine2251-2'-O)-methyltransferase
MRRDGTTDASLVVYGLNAVAGLLAGDAPVDRVLLAGGRTTEPLVTLARRRGVRCEQTDRASVERLAGTPHHQGAVAVTPAFRYADLATVVSTGRGLLLLDSIQDPRNLGAILRTARAAGIGGVVLPQDRSAGITPVVVSASAGCVFGLAIARVPNLVRAMEEAKAAGYWLVGLVPRADRTVWELPDVQKPALVVGGEGAGLRPLVRRSCDFEASLPMAPGVESLNASVAASVALYELCVRRRTGG